MASPGKTRSGKQLAELPSFPETGERGNGSSPFGLGLRLTMAKGWVCRLVRVDSPTLPFTNHTNLTKRLFVQWSVEVRVQNFCKKDSWLVYFGFPEIPRFKLVGTWGRSQGSPKRLNLCFPRFWRSNSLIRAPQHGCWLFPH